MTAIQFDFTTVGDSWNMGPCTTNPASNPAPDSNPCIYIIHNKNTNTTYAGYADNAKDRWKTRYEVFSCFGIETTYANKVVCAMCIPQLVGGKSAILLKGKNGCEHLLIRAIVNGLLGITTCSNTQLQNETFVYAGINEVRVYLPKTFSGAGLDLNKSINFGVTPY